MHTDYRYDQSGKSIFPGTPFLTCEKDDEELAFRKVKDLLTEKQLLMFRRSFEIFEPKFSKIWNHYKESRLWIDDFLSEIKSESFQKLIKRTSAICGTTNISRIKISIILSPAPVGKTAAGTAIPGYDTVTLELPELINEEWTRIYSIGVLTHEIIHIMLEREGMTKKIDAAIKKFDLPKIINGKPSSAWINEAIVESFAPGGFLMQNYYQNKIADCLLANADQAYPGSKPKSLKHYLLWRNYPMAVYYGRNKKPIDRLFIENVSESLKNFLKKKKGGF